MARELTESAYVYDLGTGQLITTMKVPGLWFATMAISPDGRVLATATRIKMWSCSTPTAKQWPTPTKPICSPLGHE